YTYSYPSPSHYRIFWAHACLILSHDELVGAASVHRDAVHAVADLGVAVGHDLRVQPFGDRLPRLARVVASESSCGGDGRKHSVGLDRVEDDRVQAQPTRARRP